MREQQRSLDRTYIPERKFKNSSRIGFRVIKTPWVYISACFVKFIYSEEATKFCEISNVILTGSKYIGQIIGGDFAKFCGLLRIYELYIDQSM